MDFMIELCTALASMCARLQSKLSEERSSENQRMAAEIEKQVALLEQKHEEEIAQLSNVFFQFYNPHHHHRQQHIPIPIPFTTTIRITAITFTINTITQFTYIRPMKVCEDLWRQVLRDNPKRKTAERKL